MKPRLHIDLETYCDLDIKTVSMDRYAGHSSTRILMCAWSFDDGPVNIWQEGEPTEELFGLLRSHTLVVWNANFERSLISKVWKLDGLDFYDAMILSLYCGLPAGLKDCNKVPFFANDAETSKESILINKFCKPQKDGVVRGPDTDPEDWARFLQYCKDDVHDTRLILLWLLKRFTLPDRVMRGWLLDQKINARGIPIDRALTYQAWEEAQRLQVEGADALKALTGLENPNSPVQLLKWLKDRGYEYGGLAKELVKKALTEGGRDQYVDD